MYRQKVVENSINTLIVTDSKGQNLDPNTISNLMFVKTNGKKINDYYYVDVNDIFKRNKNIIYCQLDHVICNTLNSDLRHVEI